jgi:hypothetical protein
MCTVLAALQILGSVGEGLRRDHPHLLKVELLLSTFLIQEKVMLLFDVTFAVITGRNLVAFSR